MKKLFGLSLLSLFSTVVFAEPLKEYTKEDIIVEEYSLREQR
ncbi:MAG: hypothetical protein SPL08_04910 [Pseudomonadota bacterium]|nr:hypothetical protein [Pseudomonadota bacterium]